jgi:uncharacterized SAM-binding protein YcdF (DUF218 family)
MQASQGALSAVEPQTPMIDPIFALKKLVTVLVLPPLSTILLLACGLLLMRKRPRLALTLSWSALVVLTLCSLPVTSQLLMHLLRLPSGLSSEAATAAKAIVVLGGGRQTAPEYGGSTISAMTLERVRYGAKLAAERRLPLLLSGGTVYRGDPEALLMDRALRQSFATQARWLEQRSRDTAENAQYSAAILKSAGIRTVLVVTHDIHQRRSVAEFAAAGLEAVPAPVSMVPPGISGNAIDHLPNDGAFRRNVMLLHEILGNLAQWLRRD